jgi:hypothetical protein
MFFAFWWLPFMLSDGEIQDPPPRPFWDQWIEEAKSHLQNYFDGSSPWLNDVQMEMTEFVIGAGLSVAAAAALTRLIHALREKQFRFHHLKQSERYEALGAMLLAMAAYGILWFTAF